MNGVFITGSDTNVGKTIFSALLLSYVQDYFSSVHYIKPIQSGSEKDQVLISSLVPTVKASEIESLKRPLSPHIAADKEQRYLDFSSILEATKNSMRENFHVVEGAGGLFVPINNRYFMIDLISHLSLPVILVVRSSLGTINHSLLSINALRSKGIPIAAVVLIGDTNKDNHRSISYYGAIKEVYSLPFLNHINKERIKDFVAEHRTIFKHLLKGFL